MGFFPSSFHLNSLPSLVFLFENMWSFSTQKVLKHKVFMELDTSFMTTSIRSLGYMKETMKSCTEIPSSLQWLQHPQSHPNSLSNLRTSFLLHPIYYPILSILFTKYYCYSFQFPFSRMSPPSKKKVLGLDNLHSFFLFWYFGF